MAKLDKLDDMIQAGYLAPEAFKMVFIRISAVKCRVLNPGADDAGSSLAESSGLDCQRGAAVVFTDREKDEPDAIKSFETFSQPPTSAEGPKGYKADAHRKYARSRMRVTPDLWVGTDSPARRVSVPCDAVTNAWYIIRCEQTYRRGESLNHHRFTFHPLQAPTRWAYEHFRKPSPSGCHSAVDIREYTDDELVMKFGYRVCGNKAVGPGWREKSNMRVGAEREMNSTPGPILRLSIWQPNPQAVKHF
ncbi:hypothetical protein B0T19DRAFT_398058 [Cercophora scortea]|uniref:Uncharacterized protein n=1 Tax=Cercophora scortea TaxID=314031 RepID=A0AAE0IW07_9PEZI|nr:hypothetical protein B0T19DRAFT_398058 [Cercophora scortea]